MSDLNSIIDHEWTRKAKAGIPLVHDDPDCARHRCSAYNSLRGKEIEGCFCSCHLPESHTISLLTPCLRATETPETPLSRSK